MSHTDPLAARSQVYDRASSAVALDCWLSSARITPLSKSDGKHDSAAPVSFEKSSYPSQDTQPLLYIRTGSATPPLHTPCLFSDLRRGTSASPLPSRTSRRRSQALKGHARGTRGRHTMRLSHRASAPPLFYSKAVRDLHWAISSPGLLTPAAGVPVVSDEWCHRLSKASISWLRELDADPGRLEEWLQRQRNVRRLGFYLRGPGICLVAIGLDLSVKY